MISHFNSNFMEEIFPNTVGFYSNRIEKNIEKKV